MATGTVAVAFSAGGLAFTLADGSTDFVSGDGFNITVTLTSKKYLQLDKSVATGENIAAGVLYADVTVPDGTDAKGVAFVRDCEANGNELVWPTGISAANKADAIQELAAIGVLVR